MNVNRREFLAAGAGFGLVSAAGGLVSGIAPAAHADPNPTFHAEFPSQAPMWFERWLGSHIPTSTR